MTIPLLTQKRDEHGYVLVYLPSHPDARDGYVFLHRLVMETALGGRLPPGCEVHHRDRDPSNNTLENLQLLPLAFHRSLHNLTGEQLEQAAEECDAWAADRFEGLRGHYEHARTFLPVEWSTRTTPAALAKGSRDLKNIDVISGKCDARIRAAEKAGTAPEDLAAALGCHVEWLRKRLQILRGEVAVTRKAGREPGRR